MTGHTWKHDPMSTIQEWERTGSTEPLVWAWFTVAALHYLDDLDKRVPGGRHPVLGHHPDIVDLHHARTATASAITALDLCAASLGRRYAGLTRDADLRDFDSAVKTKQAAKLRPSIPQAFLDWIDAVLADVRYDLIHEARNPFTHSWLSRTLKVGGDGGHVSRTDFRVRGHGAVNTRTLVESSVALATDHVEAFLGIVAAGQT